MSNAKMQMVYDIRDTMKGSGRL